MKVILSSTYFGPIQWYQKLNQSEECWIERHESFVKQTYRNRMVIAAANGPLSLSIPIIHAESLLMKDIRISDHANWRHVHWNALVSAYGESPFFEYYQDDIRPFYEKRWDFLFDFNQEITEKMIALLDIRPQLRVTSLYERQPEGKVDFRVSIRPKHPLPDASFVARRYYQVYGQRHGFLSNLSILDLLFNEGNEAIFYL